MSEIQQLEATMRALGDKFEAGMSSYEERIASLAAPNSNSCPDVVSLAADFSRFKSFVTETFLLLRQQVEALSAGLDRLEMKSRDKVLLFHGIPEVEGENSVSKIISLIEKKLGICDIDKANIVLCHRLGQLRANPKRPRPILVRFGKLSDRNNVWMSKTKLKGNEVSVSEFLTRTRHRILLEARKRLDMKQAWSQDGTVVIAVDGKRHKVNTLTQLDDLLKSVPVRAPRTRVEETTAPKVEKSSRRATSKTKK